MACKSKFGLGVKSINAFQQYLTTAVTFIIKTSDIILRPLEYVVSINCFFRADHDYSFALLLKSFVKDNKQLSCR